MTLAGRHYTRRSVYRSFLAVTALLVTLSPIVSSPARADEIRPIRFPIEGPSRFSNDFGAPRSGGRTHQGNDLFAAKLQTAVAVADGKISFARIDSSGNAGNMLIIKDAQGWEYSYLHMNNDTPGTDDGSNMAEWAMMPGLRQGSRVVAGQPIAFVGDSGNAEGTASHVHFEIHGPDNTVINPFESLQAASREPFANNHPGAASPVGAIDQVTRVPGGIQISGWSIDPDTTGPVTVMAYPNGHWGGETKANKERADLVGLYPNSGIKHGFSMVVPALATGVFTTCVYATNAEAGLATKLGCPSMQVTVNPFGSIDRVDRKPQGISISGWAMDPDVMNSTDLHVYVDGAFAAAVTGKSERSDIATAFPVYGAHHGFNLDIPMSEGFHLMCVYGINMAGGENSLIGCRWIMNTSDPWSNLDAVTRQGSVINVAGWTIDPDTSSPATVHIYMDGVHVGFTAANAPRTDLLGSYPRYSEQHGFSIDIPADPSPHTLCAYSVNQGPGQNTLIGCKAA